MNCQRIINWDASRNYKEGDYYPRKNYDYHIERENRIEQFIERQRTRGQIMVQDIDTILQDCEEEIKFKSTNRNLSYNFPWASMEINTQLSQVIRDELKSHGISFSTSVRVADLKYELQRHYSNTTNSKFIDVNLWLYCHGDQFTHDPKAKMSLVRRSERPAKAPNIWYHHFILHWKEKWK